GCVGEMGALRRGHGPRSSSWFLLGSLLSLVGRRLRKQFFTYPGLYVIIHNSGGVVKSFWEPVTLLFCHPGASSSCGWSEIALGSLPFLRSPSNRFSHWFPHRFPKAIGKLPRLVRRAPRTKDLYEIPSIPHPLPTPRCPSAEGGIILFMQPPRSSDL